MSGGASVAGWTGAIGSAFQQRATMEAEKAADHKRVEELNRQRDYALQGGRIVQENAKFKGAENTEQLRKQGEQARLSAFDRMAQQNVFGGQRPQMQGMDRLRANQLGKSRAVLGSYGDWAIRDLIQNIQVQNELNKLNSTAMGSANVIAPAEINKAQHSADVWKVVGGTISGAGNVLGGAMESKGPSGGQGGQAPGYSVPSSGTSNAGWAAQNM